MRLRLLGGLISTWKKRYCLVNFDPIFSSRSFIYFPIFWLCRAQKHWNWLAPKHVHDPRHRKRNQEYPRSQESKNARVLWRTKQHPQLHNHPNSLFLLTIFLLHLLETNASFQVSQKNPMAFRQRRPRPSKSVMQNHSLNPYKTLLSEC